MLRKLSGHHLQRQVSDPALRQALIPDFNPGCKRLLISNTWFPTLQRPNVQLVTQGVARIAPEGVVGADGALYPCDVIVWGTGFKATEFVAPMQVYGESANGEPLELGKLWGAQP
ncbi:MAG: hypothetical protein RL081_396, partial [Pseudomonadota bacterium]